jgi:hypothetical protein
MGTEPPNKSLKIKGKYNKDVKNEGTSQLVIENKGAKEALPMSS